VDDPESKKIIPVLLDVRAREIAFHHAILSSDGKKYYPDKV
jgi:hypothetical protein